MHAIQVNRITAIALCTLMLSAGALATEDLSTVSTENLLKLTNEIIQQRIKNTNSDTEFEESRVILDKIMVELRKRGYGPPNNVPPGLRPKEIPTVVPDEFFPPQNAAPMDALPDGLAFGAPQEEWRLGISAQAASSTSGSQVDVVLALENQKDSDRHYMTSGASHPLDIIIVSESGASATLGMEMKIHWQMWANRFRGRIIAGRSAEIFRLQFGPEYFKGFSGRCLLYARAHIPEGKQQQRAEILSDSVVIHLTGDSPAPAGAVRFGSAATSRTAHGKRNEHSAHGVSSKHPPARADNELDDGMKGGNRAWLLAGLALFAVAAGIVLRAILRTHSNSTASRR